ncbi:hypothetical protein D9757_005660 [Collybiopsis confluens]|uniref:Uncharacterized protein n=1 Tax=Collybiopsis confluens TaxID=2823264 RepID=A0A8H5HSS1_9AGAR|nr:hypothetical protein D9757_005660 [Collybiopsis confluens]
MLYINVIVCVVRHVTVDCRVSTMSNHEGIQNLKRKRAESNAASGPDGFTTSKPSSRTSKTTIPAFQSAFDKPKKLEMRKRTDGTFLLDSQFIATRAPDEVSSDTSSTPRKSTLRSGMRIPSAKKFALPTSNTGIAQLSTSDSSTSQPISGYVPSKLKVPIPVDWATKNVTKPPLKSLVPPRLPPPKSPIAGKKSLPPKLPLQPPPPPPKALRTIGTTRVALATDISTENGTAEIASLFLQGSSEMEIPDLVRSGLEQSPQKGYSTVQGPRFIRNGLAAQAAALLSRRKTSLALWTTEFSALARFPKADLILRVHKVIHRPNPDRSASSMMTGLALCAIRGKQSPFGNNKKLGPQAGAEFPIRDDDMENFRPLVLVLLGFALNPSQASSPICNAIYLEPNAEFSVWKPWRTLALGASQIQSLASLVPGLEEVHSNALLCDRFGHRKPST